MTHFLQESLIPTETTLSYNIADRLRIIRKRCLHWGNHLQMHRLLNSSSWTLPLNITTCPENPMILWDPVRMNTHLKARSVCYVLCSFPSAVQQNGFTNACFLLISCNLLDVKLQHLEFLPYSTLSSIVTTTWKCYKSSPGTVNSQCV